MNKKRIEAEIDFKNLLKNPIRLFGFIFPLIVVVFIALGVFYIKSLDSITFNFYSPVIEDSVKTAQPIPLKKGGILPAVDLELVKTPNEEMIAKGKELYNANCMSCHGANGLGDGPAGLALNPKPRNFTVVDGWTNGRKLFDLYKTLQEGIIKNGMAAYEYLSPEDRISIIHYVRTFAEFPEITENEVSSELDLTYNLSAGTQVPNQIPINKSISKILSENEKIELKESEDLGSKLLNELSSNKIKTSALLTNSNVKNFEEFVDIVSSNPIEFGLKGEVNTLSKNEWMAIFNFINKSKS